MFLRFIFLIIVLILPSCSSSNVVNKRADCDNAESCANLGFFYRNQDIKVPLAMQYFQKACDLGGSCTPIAVGYLNGDGVLKDVIKAKTILERDCEAGTGSSCYFLAGLYEDANGVERDMNRAAALLEEACVGGSTPGCVKSGRVAKNQQACASGDGEACFNAGLFYQDNKGPLASVINNRVKARYHFQKACEAGHAEGCAGLDQDSAVSSVERSDIESVIVSETVYDLKGRAVIYTLELDAREDLTEGENPLHMLAVEDHLDNSTKYDTDSIKKDCFGDDPLQCYNFAIVNLLFINIEKRFESEENEPASVRLKTAMGLFAMACEAGHVGACHQVGRGFWKGHGLPRDPAKAAVLFQRICSDDAPVACSDLANIHYAGHGVKQDSAKAASLNERACDLGLSISCTNLGVAYEMGEGVARDARKALTLYERACESGEANACDRFAALK